MYFCTDLHMVLYMERKLREIGGSIVITLPKHVRDINNFKPGDNPTNE